MTDPGDRIPVDRVRSLPMGTELEIRKAGGRTWVGTLVPSHEFSADGTVQLKLESGYNIGVRLGADDHVRVLGAPVSDPASTSTSEAATGPTPTTSASAVWLLTTGGTIASRVDYHTGGVRPVQDPSELRRFFPDLESEGPVQIVPVLDRLSEDISPDDWMVLAADVGKAFRAGARGVVIAHGTDTLAFTAAALSFLVENPPGPVVIVGAQRSPDRPSSDAFLNLVQAVRLARRADLFEVVVVMHGGLPDDRFAIHRGTRVRKMHSSRRDAFESRSGTPLGWIQGTEVRYDRPVRPRSDAPLAIGGPLDAAGGLLWFYPGLGPDRAQEFVRGLRGVVLAGTGLGHVSSTHLGWIREAVGRGVVVAMTTQTLAGEVDPYVYSTGRELLRAGVLFLHDLLPEAAYAKLLWALGRSSDPAAVGRLLLENRVGEFEFRHEVTPTP